MLTDAQLQLTAITGLAITADAASTNQIDTGEARDLERGGTPLRFVVEVLEAFNNLTSLTVALRQSAASNMGSPNSFYTSEAIVLASLTLGAKIIDMPFPARRTPLRYIDAYVDITGTAPSTGKLWMGFVIDSEGGEYRLGNTGF